MKRIIPELTKLAIRNAYATGEGSYATLAKRFKVSVPTVRRICQGITKGQLKQMPPPSDHTEEGNAALEDATITGKIVVIDGIDITDVLQAGIIDMLTDMKDAKVKSKEGMARATLAWMKFLMDLKPPTMEMWVDQLLTRDDFDPYEFAAILKRKYARQQAGL